MEDKDSDFKHDKPGIFEGRSVSRREFLRLAGLAGAAFGLSAGLGGALAACGEAEETTTTAGGATTSTSGGSTTSVSARPEVGRDIKIGLVSPKTGALALFAKADDWWTEFALAAQGDGFVCGDGKLHKFTFIKADSQSDSNRAAQVAGDLITNNKVDIVMCSGSPDTVNPVADQAETLGCPNISNFVP